MELWGQIENSEAPGERRCWLCILEGVLRCWRLEYLSLCFYRFALFVSRVCVRLGRPPTVFLCSWFPLVFHHTSVAMPLCTRVCYLCICPCWCFSRKNPLSPVFWHFQAPLPVLIIAYSLHSICVHPALFLFIHFFKFFFAALKRLAATTCTSSHSFFLKPAAVYTVSWSAEWKAVLHAAQTFFFLSATIHIYTMAKAHHQTLDLFCAQHFSRFFFFTFLGTLNIVFWLWSHHNSSQLYFDASVYCIPPAHCI